jgi:nucleoside-diphosphate-sugar epimerase
VEWLPLDIKDQERVAATLNGRQWDAVVNWIGYEPVQIERDLELFRGKTRQYIFISSAAAYQKPPKHYRITEETPLDNPFWEYARKKIACEQRLLQAYRTQNFPVTIVRPSLTYGETWIPCTVGGHDYTVVNRIRQGKPVIVHGDGQSLWTMTHNTDFALGLVGLLGQEKALGECFHITSDEVLTWDRIYRLLGDAAGMPPKLVYIPSNFIARFDARIGDSLLGDKRYSLVYDNSKIKKFVPEYQPKVPFAEGIRQSVAWFDADADRQKVNPNMDNLLDRIVAAYEKAG